MRHSETRCVRIRCQSGINALFGLKPWYSTVWWVTGGTAGAYAHWACSNEP